MTRLAFRRPTRTVEAGTWVLILCLVAGCSTTRHGQAPLQPAVVAARELPEEQLLDVGIVVFEPGDVTPSIEKRDGTDQRIRTSEAHFIPYHLKDTLQQTGFWGAVRVLPEPIEHTDLLITGKILESDGKTLAIEVTARDAAGVEWLRKTYALEAEDSFFGDVELGSRDVYQPVYNQIANDLLEVLRRIPPESRERIRTIARVRFAGELAPEPFADYLRSDARGRRQLIRLPAENDPMLQRLEEVRERENMYVDTLDEYYERLYGEMWPEYLDWRKYNYAEQKALDEIQRQKWTRMVGGALMIALAIALDVGDVNKTGTLRDVLVLGGGAVVVSGVNVSQQANLHKAALEELSDSFGAKMEPIVIELEGKQIELTGSAQEQFTQWRQILRDLYRAETGFEPEESDPAKQPAT